MNSTEIPLFNEDSRSFSPQEKAHSPSHWLIKEFDRIILFYALFLSAFFGLMVTEVILFAVFFPILIQTSFAAFALAGLLMTVFSYFTLNQYFKAQKPEKIQGLMEAFIQSCKENLSYREGDLDHHIALSTACSKMADTLNNREFSYYFIPKSFRAPLLEKISCYFHWRDLHLLKALLLKASVEEHLKLVRREPTSLHIHAALANAYVMLSGLYLDPRKMEGYDNDQWIPPGKYDEEMQERFREFQERAIEEFKILKEFAPSDPWVYTQLALSYRDLQMPSEEIKAYEAIIKLRPSDLDTLFKLGVLYFQEGENALGLKVYEELKKAHFKKAEMLMNYYGIVT